MPGSSETLPAAVQAWRDFYVTSGAAAATLVGLLFVGLSLHIRVVVSHPDVRSLARVTLADFFVVLLLSLLMLIPGGDPRTTALWLLVVAAISLALIVRPTLDGFRSSRRRTLELRTLVTRFGLSALCCVAIAATGVLFDLGDFRDALDGLLLVVVLLLVVAVRNAWDILVTVADRAGSGSR